MRVLINSSHHSNENSLARELKLSGLLHKPVLYELRQQVLKALRL